MKRILNVFMILLSILLFTSVCFAEKIQVDTTASVLNWTGKKITENHSGIIKLKSGYVEIEDEQVIGGEFILDMNTIENTDIENETYSNKLTGHLKSHDFFNVAEFPEGKFVIKRVKDGKIPTSEATIVGELTIKDHTHFVTFPTTLAKVGDVYSTKGKAILDRTKWDVRHNSKKWFDPTLLGDKLIHDEFDIELDVKTIK